MCHWPSFLARETCDLSDGVCALKQRELDFVYELLAGKMCNTHFATEVRQVAVIQKGANGRYLVPN